MNATRPSALWRMTMVAGLMIALALMVTSGTVPTRADKATPAPPANKTTHIVLLSPTASAAEVARSHGLGLVSVYRHALSGMAVTVPAGRLRALKRDPRVLLVEPNLTVKVLGEPGVVVTALGGDPGTLSTQVLPTGVDRVDADLSGMARIDGIDERVPVVVAVLDTGVDGSHPDLNVNVARSADCSGGLSCEPGTAVDVHGHGTLVAGTIGAIDNDFGVVGVAPGAEIWSVRVCRPDGSCGLDAILSAHDYISANADSIDVANVSLGGLGWSESWRVAIADNVARGVVVVVAAGNASRDIYGYDGTIGNGNEFIPATYPEAAAISALADSDGMAGGLGGATEYGADDTLASFSNYSLAVVADNPVVSPGAAVDLAAPGVNVLSTHLGGGYAYFSGTSASAPHAAGVAALEIAEHGRARDAAGVAAIRQALIDAAAAMADWRPDSADSDSDPDANHEPSVLGPAGSVPPTPDPVHDAAVADVRSPATVIQGDSVTVGVTLRNDGTVEETVELVVTDATAGTPVGTASALLPVGGSADVEVVWDTGSAAPGPHTLLAEAIVAGDSDPADNTGTSGTVVEASVTDIALAGFTAPASTTVGDPVALEMAIANAGNREVPDDIPIQVVSDNATPSDPSDDFVVAAVTLTGGLPVGGTSVLSATWDTGGVSSGAHTLTARHTLSDMNVGNDAQVASVELLEAPSALVVTVASDRAAYAKRDRAFIRVTVATSTGDPASRATVQLLITGANGWSQVLSGTAGQAGEIVFRVKINYKRSGCGTYTAAANAQHGGAPDAVASMTFLVCS